MYMHFKFSISFHYLVFSSMKYVCKCFSACANSTLANVCARFSACVLHLIHTLVNFEIVFVSFQVFDDYSRLLASETST